MTNIPLSMLPGVCKVNSTYASSSQQGGIYGRTAIGRITDMDKARFVASFPETIGGWEKEIETAMLGVPRGSKDWRDNNQAIYLGAGTNRKLYYYQNLQLVDITPLRGIETGTLTNAISTTNGSSTITVADAAHGQQVGDYVLLTSASTVGGLTIAGVYVIATAATNSYTVDVGVLATSTQASGGGATSFEYYRITLTNPFSTVNGSPTVTVSQLQHGAMVGDSVTISGGSAVGGITLSGEYFITTVDNNSYTITAASAATSTATGGGTPSFEYEISIGNADSSLAFGYGTGGYGENGYGTVSTTGILLSARTWCLQNYGQQLLANPYGGTIYVWDPIIQGRAYRLYGAPDEVLGMFVTPERFVIALGINGLTMRIAWPDQSDYTNWISTATNTANSGRTLQEGSYLVNGIAVRDGVSMLFTNTTAYNFDYIGDNEIYSSTVAGKKCGLVGPLAVAVIGGVAYWMSLSEFWQWNGSVLPLPSDDIRDFVFQDLNKAQAAKFVAGTNIAKKEVFFFYCSADSDEIDRYVIYQIDQACFSCGTMERTTWLDRGLFDYPMTTDASGYLYKQEYGLDADGAAMDSYVVFSPIDIATADRIMDIWAFVPDFKRQVGEMELYPMAQDYPQSAEVIYGPETIQDDGSTPIIGLRIGARLLGYKLRSNVIGGDWRLGLPLAEVEVGGARR